ncbi:MAG TPA: hypothetical protein VNZ52_02080, partial [Candidatus Thermoplasmatota archaeon]|nr:hypothetical protein [Candidatus Thermoplasmatota archaeon]
MRRSGVALPPLAVTLLLVAPALLAAVPATADAAGATALMLRIPTLGRLVEGAYHVPTLNEGTLQVEYALVSAGGAPAAPREGTHALRVLDSAGEILAELAGEPTPTGWYRATVPTALLQNALGGLRLEAVATDRDTGHRLLTVFKAPGTAAPTGTP